MHPVNIGWEDDLRNDL